MLTWEDEERKVRKVQRPSGGRALFGRQFDSRPEQIEIWGRCDGPAQWSNTLLYTR